MAEKDFGQVEGDAAEEEDYERRPGDSLGDRVRQSLPTKSVPHNTVRDGRLKEVRCSWKC